MLLLQKWCCLAWVMLCKPREEMRLTVPHSSANGCAGTTVNMVFGVWGWALPTILVPPHWQNWPLKTEDEHEDLCLPGRLQRTAAPRPKEDHHIIASCTIFAVSESKPLPQKLLGKSRTKQLSIQLLIRDKACYCLTHKALYSQV